MTFLQKISQYLPARKANVIVTDDRSTGVFQRLFGNFLMFTNSPTWYNYNSDILTLFEKFMGNPVFYAVVAIKAREDANRRYVVEHRETHKVEPQGTRKTIPARIYQLMDNPNVLQARAEWTKQRKVFSQVAGNSFTFGASPMGFRPNINNITALWNVHPAFMKYQLAGKFFEATDINEIIKGWYFELGKYVKEWTPDQILHQNEPAIDISKDLILGTPIAYSLEKPLSNIEIAYESRNVIMKNRGMRVMFTSNKGDASGKVPLMDQEIKQVEEAIKKYGTREGQTQFFFSNQPLTATPIDQDVMKLGLFEEIATDAMMVCNAFGVPEILLKLYLAGATFENQQESVKRLYNGTLIPEAEEDMTALNKFLGLDETEWVLKASFDHIPGLQKSERDRAEANAKTSQYMERLFLNGAVTHNQWLSAVGLEPYGPDGDKRIWEMEPEKLAIILKTPAPKPEAPKEEGEDPATAADPAKRFKLNGHVMAN